LRPDKESEKTHRGVISPACVNFAEHHEKKTPKVRGSTLKPVVSMKHLYHCVEFPVWQTGGSGSFEGGNSSAATGGSGSFPGDSGNNSGSSLKSRFMDMCILLLLGLALY
jgi:hypothetical protein